MRDDDLLIPLRFLSAVDNENKYSRPLFALLPRSHDNNEARFYQLYERYGIHVLTYGISTDTLEDHTIALCKEIENIGNRSRTHRKEWLEKPAFKQVQSPPEIFLHYDPIFPDPQATQSEHGLHVDFRSFLDTTTHVLWILGPGGTGKSWEAIRQLKQLSGDNATSRFDGFFFWSFRHSNDALSGICHALRFMNEEVGPAEHLLDQLIIALREKHYFLVFDGIERFLHHNVDKGNVVAVDSSWRRFFVALADMEKSFKSFLVLISRILPTESPERRDRKTVGASTIRELKGFSIEQIGSMRSKNGGGTEDGEVEECIFSWFRGHRYGVALAVEWLKMHQFEQLEYDMAGADSEHRVSKMIGLSLKAIRETGTLASEYTYCLLERLAVFVEPVGKEVARACLDPIHKGDLEAAIEQLKMRKLLFEVRYYDGTTRYMVHPSTREYIFHHDHHSSPAELPSFAMTGFTSGAETVYPGDRQSPGRKTVIGLVESLIKETSRQLPISSESQISPEVVSLCRAAFGVIRSRMVATTVSRWSRYDEYLRLLIQVIDLVRGLSPRMGGKSASSNSTSGVISNAALYADELVWLYNEAGLAYYSYGYMVDAIAVWNQSYEISNVLDGGDGHRVFQSLCNLGGAHIHFGLLRKAEVFLYKALEMGQKLEEVEHIARIKVYLALLFHLRGNIAEANKGYERVTEDLGELGNMRAYSNALRHHADLLLKQDATRAQAWKNIQTSKAVAEANSYHDLVAYSRLSYGQLYRIEKNFPEAIREYSIALELARTMGLRRLEAEAQSELARMDLDLGDSHGARRRAMKALQIANEHLLGLRQTHCLVILGKATIRTGERELGIHYLRYAKTLADAQEYRLRANEAEAALYEIGEPIENAGVEKGTMG